MIKHKVAAKIRKNNEQRKIRHMEDVEVFDV